MLPLSPFRLEQPENVEDALRLLAQDPQHTRLCAGGTDLVPNIKHGLHTPDVVVHLGRLESLRGVAVHGDTLRIGAMVTLHALSQHALVQQHAPGLALAAASVAGPQIRRMGTLGGNLCLDTRCLYYNQTHFWREALGHCLKKDGTRCHVVEGGRRCVAAASNDTATMLLALDGSVEISSARGKKMLPLRQFYVANGEHNTVLEPDEMVTQVEVPLAGSNRREGFAKLRHRAAVDFPMLNVGVAARVTAQNTVESLGVCVSALAARPVVLDTRAFVGRVLDDALRADVAALARTRCVPVTNITDDPEWRRDMVPVMVKRAWPRSA